MSQAHAQLDVIEKQLALLQERQQVLLDRQAGTKKKKGRVEHLDLRSIIELVEEDGPETVRVADDDFDQRFDTFAAADTDDRARRWMDAH